MGWFTPSIDEELLDWELSHWKWLAESLRRGHDLSRIHLVQPTPEGFPVVAKSSEERASKVFECVKEHFGLKAWPCKLVPFEEAHDVMRDVLPVLLRPETSDGAAGLFEVSKEREVIIRYKPDQTSDPMSMIGTMAHEMSHYVLATIRQEPPGGWTQHEPITDLASVFFGFGIFLANSSFRFFQWADYQYQGWSAKRQGYLSENALSLALALFCACRDIAPDIVARHLTTNPRHYFRNYHKELLKRHMDAVVDLKITTRNAEPTSH